MLTLHASRSHTANLAIYEKAQNVGPLQSDVEQLVTTVLARASYEWRALQAGKVGMYFAFNILQDPNH